MHKYILIALFSGIALTAHSQTLKEAIRLNENEQHEAASAVYQQLIAKEPSNGSNYYYYGENLIDADNPDSAKIIFEKGLIVDNTNPLCTIGLAELKLMQGNMKEAKSLIDGALIIGNNKNAILLLEAAEAYIRYKEKDLIAAQALLDKAAILEPKNSEIYNLMGDVYSELNNGSMAANNYNKALELDKNQVKALLHKGQLYKRSTNYDGAAAEFQNALSIDPNFAPAYRELGEVMFKQRKLDEAKGYYKKYLDLSKNNVNARLRYSYFLYESSSYTEASNELNLITKVDSGSLGMMRIMSYVNYEVGKNDSALRTIVRVFLLTANDTTRRFSRDYSYYGKILAKAGNDSLGAQYIKSAIAMDPKQPELYDDLADLYNKAKKFDLAALAYSDKIANMVKSSTTDHFNLGRAWYSAKDYIKADSAFMKVTELNPAWPNGYFWRGRTNALMDPDAKIGAAAPYYVKYIELIEADSVSASKYKNNLIEAYSTLGFTSYVMKDCTKSIEYWNKVLILDAASKQGKDAIESIKKSKLCK